MSSQLAFSPIGCLCPSAIRELEPSCLPPWRSWEAGLDRHRRRNVKPGRLFWSISLLSVLHASCHLNLNQTSTKFREVDNFM